MWEDTAAFIKRYDSFLLTTHINPEGDAIGSEVALKLFLESLGKRVTIVNSSPTPANCEFLDPEREIHVYPNQYKSDMMSRADAVIILDVNGWIHIGSFADVLKGCGKPSACIDHHEAVENKFADFMVRDTAAASAGLLVYEGIKFMGGEITPRIAEAVYASLITDTGTFRFTNTNERAFLVAAELCAIGAKPFALHRQIFGNKSWQAARLLGPVLNTIGSAADGKLAWIHMTRDMLDAASAQYEDSDGIIDPVRAIKGVELCLFFKETERGTVKISLRSNGNVDAYRLARKYGGGGHRMAAGMTLSGDMESVIKTVVREALELEELRG
ncbi:MAG: bifunctional oligoribonuclease/PAP phosphatase NrnA [Chitinivibrionia bacterium]|nr:bifunctional oligoribonuclease/PAP phosphatase NrnA [Chitinivibrionia bacterium]